MPASIYGERFAAFRGGPGWHRLGTVMDDPQMTAVEGIKIAGLDYEYQSAPIGYQLPTGHFVQDNDRVAILRGPSRDDNSWSRVGIVGKDYTYLQNHELAAGIDRIRESTGWQLETLGALGEGEMVFMSLYAGTRAVYGDEIKSYFLVSDDKSGKRALTISNTPVRTVCQNTLMLAESKASTQIKLAHSSSVDTDYALWTEVIPALEQVEAGAFAELEQMASVQVDRKAAEKIIAAAYPEPRTNQKVHAANVLKSTALVDVDVLAKLLDARSAHETELDRILATREAVMGRYDALNDNIEGLPEPVISKIAGTPYMALQAITETADWADSLRGRSTDSAALFGNRRATKSRAWAAALAAAK